MGGALAATVGLVLCVKKPVWGLYAALIVVLLPTGLLPATVHSNLNRGLTVFAFGVWLISVLVRRRTITWTLSTSFMAAFVIWGMVTLLWADNLDAGTNEIQVYALRLALFFVLIPNEIRTSDSLDGLMRTLALSGWMLVLAGLGTLLLEGYTPGSRFQILEMNENGIGMLALVTLPGILWGVIRASGHQRTVRALFSYAFIGAALVLVALSGSRGSALSFAITLLAFSAWRATRSWATLGLVLVVVALILMPALFSTLTARFQVEAGDTVLGGREAIWLATLQVIREHPWGGVGIGGARYAVLPYVILLRSIGGSQDVSIHNPLLATWAGTGLSGIALYLGVIVSAAWSFAASYRRCLRGGRRDLIPYFAVIWAVFLGYMVSWFKAGGGETGFSYFLMLSLLVIPSRLLADSMVGRQEGTQVVVQAMSSEASSGLEA